MRMFLIAAATATVFLAGSALSQAEAAMPASAAAVLPPLTQSAPPVENVACWCGPYRCACRRYWGPRVYWGPRRYWGPRYRWRY